MMQENGTPYQSIETMQQELEELRYRLEEANDTIEAIRTGQIDALVVQGENGHQLYTLESADQTYRIIIENMNEGAVTLNSDGIIMYSNSRFVEMTGNKRSGTAGLPFEAFICAEDLEHYKQLLAGTPDSDSGEISLMKGSENLPVKLSLTSLELETGKALSIIITDLSDQKAAQARLLKSYEQLAETNAALEASNHELQQFASVASHDLQEPLRKIQVYSEFLRTKQDNLEAEYAKYVGKIVDSATRMRILITDILNYSRLSATEDYSDPVELNDLLKELKDDFELSIRDKNAVINLDNLPCLQINKGQMRQVFQNIVNNALKFAKKDEAPVISITSKKITAKSFDAAEDPDGAYCMISIRDNGIGFEEKYAAHIFELFERLNPKDKYEGTGIGLAIAKKIIDRHNGLITAVSDSNGAEFRIILPMRQSK